MVGRVSECDRAQNEHAKFAFDRKIIDEELEEIMSFVLHSGKMFYDLWRYRKALGEVTVTGNDGHCWVFVWG